MLYPPKSNCRAWIFLEGVPKTIPHGRPDSKFVTEVAPGSGGSRHKPWTEATVAAGTLPLERGLIGVEMSQLQRFENHERNRKEIGKSTRNSSNSTKKDWRPQHATANGKRMSLYRKTAGNSGKPQETCTKAYRKAGNLSNKWKPLETLERKDLDFDQQEKRRSMTALKASVVCVGAPYHSCVLQAAFCSGPLTAKNVARA